MNKNIWCDIQLSLLSHVKLSYFFYIYPEIKAAYDEEKGKHAATEDSVKSLAQELKVKSQEIEHLKTDLVNIVGAFFCFTGDQMSLKLSI